MRIADLNRLRAPLEEWELCCFQASSAGSSKSTRSPRKPRVLIAPKAMPTIIQIPPTIQAFQLRFFQRKKQMLKPASGGVQTARTASAPPPIIHAVVGGLGNAATRITAAVKSPGTTGLVFPSRTL